jgi:hypothetical protein
MGISAALVIRALLDQTPFILVSGKASSQAMW